MDRIKITSLASAQEVTPIYLEKGGQTFALVPTLPYAEIFSMVQWAVEVLVGETTFISYPLTRMVKDFAILHGYTNLDFAVFHEDATTELLCKDYDIVKNQGILEDVRLKINKEQVDFFEKSVDATLSSIITYRNSAKGIVDGLAAEAQDDTEKMQKVMQFMDDSKAQEQVKAILTAAQEIQ